MNDEQEYKEEKYISKEGYEALQKKLEELKTTRRVEIANKLESAKSLGDLSENAEYSAAKEEHMVNETKIMRLEDFLSRATIIKKPSASSVVTLGNTVVVSNHSGISSYTIVGTHEVDIAGGKISHKSPFGKAFLGKRKGDAVPVKGPKGERTYIIIDIT